MMIGGFVVIAVVLLAASVVVFGSRKFFKQTNKYILYFDGSIKGLNVGAPVLFQGVPIGTVVSIALRAHAGTMTTEIPVVIEIEQGKFEVVGAETPDIDYYKKVQRIIDKGLRAVLVMQSLITGQLLIELDFYPDTPVQLRNTEVPYPEIPTVPSTVERLGQSFAKLDLEGMQKNLENTLNGIDALVNDPDLQAAITELKALLTDARGLVANLDEHVGSMADEATATLVEARKLVSNVDRQVAPVAATVNRTMDDVGQLTRSTDQQLVALSASMDDALAALRGVVSEDAPTIVELEVTLREIAAMARAFRQLAEHLERHPESLIQGKRNAGGK